MTLTIRPVGPGDLDLICRHREEMFADAGHDRDLLAPMTASFRKWLQPKLTDGSYLGWIADEDGAAVAGIGMMVLDWPPHPAHPEDARRGYVLNVFVERTHRRKGLAKALMARAETEARQRGLSYVVLHATKQGRPLYEQLGWAQTSEMAAKL